MLDYAFLFIVALGVICAIVLRFPSVSTVSLFVVVVILSLLISFLAFGDKFYSIKRLITSMTSMCALLAFGVHYKKSNPIDGISSDTFFRSFVKDKRLSSISFVALLVTLMYFAWAWLNGAG